MPTEVLENSFASAAFADAPPDGTDPGVTDPIPGVREPVKEAPKETVKEEPKKEETEKDLENPHLATTKAAKNGESTEIPSEMPAELKKGMTETAAKKAETAWKNILESEKKWKAEAEASKKTLATHQEEVTSLKKQVEELSSLKTELDAARKTLQGYEQEMSVTRVEGTREYKARVTEPSAEITATVEDIAKRYELTPDAIMRAITEPDKTKRAEALDEIVSDLKHSDQLDLVQAAKDYHRIQRVAADMRENAGAKLKELTEAEKAEQDKITSYNVDLYRSSLDEAFKQLQDRVAYIRPVEGNEKWNAYLKNQLRDAAAVDVNGLPIPAVARAIVAERMLPDIAKVAVHFETKWKEAETKAVDLEKKLEARIKLNAPAGGGKGGSEGDTAKAKGGSFVDSVF